MRELMVDVQVKRKHTSESTSSHDHADALTTTPNSLNCSGGPNWKKPRTMAQVGITAKSKHKPIAVPSLSILRPCPFIDKVPREIRDMIYCYALVRSEVHTIPTHGFECYLDTFGLESGQRSLPPVHVVRFLLGHGYFMAPRGNWNLLNTSRQIRQESLATFFRTIKLDFADSEGLVKFLRTINARCLELLSSISLNSFYLDSSISSTYFAKGRPS